MKTAIIGSRELNIEIEKYLPEGISLIVSGGASGIDTLAEKYADKKGIAKLIFKPDYRRYGKNAPLIRNKLMVERADLIIAIWDGVSTGTKFTIDYAKNQKKTVRLILIDVTGVEIMPGNNGKNCLGNGEHYDQSGKWIECCCDECSYLICCTDKNSSMCDNCNEAYCPRKLSCNEFL